MRKRTLALTGMDLLIRGRGCIDSSANPAHGTELLNPKEHYDSLTASDERPVLGFYCLNIVWGQLCLETPVAEATRWSGSLFVYRGAEIIPEAIRFKPGRNHLFPRTDLTATGWTSLTVGQDDGIAVSIVVDSPRLDSDFSIPVAISSENDTVVAIPVDTAYLEWVPAEVVFETGPCSSTFAPTEISALETSFHAVDSDIMNEMNVQEIGLIGYQESYNLRRCQEESF